MSHNLSRPCGSNTTALEDKLKRRAATEKKLAAGLAHREESIEHTAFRVVSCLSDLQRASGSLWSSLNIAEKRMELRAKRPQEEIFQDDFQDALELEQAELLEVHAQLATHLDAGKEVRTSIALAKAEMLENRLTLHLDRTPWPREFLKRTQDLEEVAMQFCSKADAALRSTEAVAAKARRRTYASMSRRVKEMDEVRRRLEREILANKGAIADAEEEVRKIWKQIKEHKNAPETQLSDSSTLDLDAFYSRASLDHAALSKLRARIKGAAYTGHSGRQLDVLFGRFDRDGSGQLDEDEVRGALRRTLRIPPTVITDPEITALCATLDGDNSGMISIKEIVDFLNADVDVSALEEQHARISSALEALHEAQDELQADLRRKGAAWKLEKSCLTVTAAKGLELDTLHLPSKSGEAQVVKRRKPLEPRVLEKVRTKLRKAAYSGSRQGRPVEGFFARFDTDRSGQLDDDELRRAVRCSFKIPNYAISDVELSSLCAMLDADSSGAVSISELVEFIGPPPTEECGDHETTLEPINKADRALDRSLLGEQCQRPTSKRGGQRGSKIAPQVLDNVRTKIKASPVSGELDVIFGQHDKAGSGAVSYEAVPRVLRRTLKIGSVMMSDADITSMCALLDPDGSGAVEVSRLVNFLGPRADAPGSARAPNGQTLEPLATAPTAVEDV